MQQPILGIVNNISGAHQGFASQSEISENQLIEKVKQNNNYLNSQNEDAFRNERDDQSAVNIDNRSDIIIEKESSNFD